MALRINHPSDNMEEKHIFPKKKGKKGFFGTLEKEDIILKGFLAQFELTFFFNILMIECEAFTAKYHGGHQKWTRDSPSLKRWT